jgi:hypothetical protein
VTPSEAAVRCPSGRWGPRRTRTSECWATLRAEDWYTALLNDNAIAVRPGARGIGTFKFSTGTAVTASWEVRANSVWRRGRVFFRCPRCAGLRTRLYLPLEHSWLACRRCWGLTYTSRTLQNYKDSIWGRGRFAWLLGTTQRDWALLRTHDRRQVRDRLTMLVLHWKAESRRCLALREQKTQQARLGQTAASAVTQAEVAQAPKQCDPAVLSATRADFPKRAEWIRDALDDRRWTARDLARHSGCDAKTIRKALRAKPSESRS